MVVFRRFSKPSYFFSMRQLTAVMSKYFQCRMRPFCWDGLGRLHGDYKFVCGPKGSSHHPVVGEGEGASSSASFLLAGRVL